MHPHSFSQRIKNETSQNLLHIIGRSLRARSTITQHCPTGTCRFRKHVFSEADFAEAWTGPLPRAARQDRVDRRISRYEKLARVRDGNLAVVGRRQDVLDMHCTGEYDQKRF